MRPLRDLLKEEYWCIGYRRYSDSDTAADGKESKKFDLIEASARYWYADPFLFEKDNRLYLFVEMFDNTTEVGMIGCSEYQDGKFSKPKPVLRESFHLSYPYVFEKDGEVFMMPETHEDGCIQLYKAVSFPDKWEKYRVLVNDVNAADTVIENGLLIASTVCPENDMTVDLSVFDADGNELPYSPVYSHRLDKRGAGKVFTHNGKRLRPTQNCENRVYGAGLFFNEITECSRQGYSETQYSALSPDKIIAGNGSQPCGIHTYGRCRDVEVVDIKFTRFNPLRLFWIVKKKLG